jgi:nucleoside-diphosphate-sugar epimerase
MSRVLVTGATGFIGSHLVEALLGRGETVRCLVRSPQRAAALATSGAELATGGLDDEAAIRPALAGIDTVYHLAGLTRALTRNEMFRVNEAGTARLMVACAEQPQPPTVVLVSSVAAAGPAPRGQLRIESDPPAPVSIYGESKLAGEAAATALADRLPLTIVRPGIVFGPRDTGLLPVFRQIRMLRFHPTPGFAPPPLSWIYISDLVDLIVQAAEIGSRVPVTAAGSGSNGQAGQGRYFAASAEYPTWVEMGRIVRPMLSRPNAWMVPVPAPLAWCVAGVSERIARFRGQAEWLNSDKIREALVTSWACSAEAARRDLGFNPPNSLAERFAQTLAWYRQEKWL